MGVTKGTLVLHKVTNLSLSDIASIGRGIAAAKGLEKPRIVADCSNIVYVLSKASSVVLSVVNLLMKWAGSGCVMVPSCDGRVRPVCKQDTNKRNAAKEKSRINAFVLRKEIRQAKASLQNDKLDRNERSSLEKKIVTMERSCKTKETQATSNKLPDNFVDELRTELSNNGAHTLIPATGGFVDQVVVAEFQADSFMAEQIGNNKAVMAMTRDSDIPILCGDDCIAVKEFTRDSFEIVCVSESNLNAAMSCLPSDSKAKFTPAQYPLFEANGMERLERTRMSKQAVNDWSKLKSLTFKRSVRNSGVKASYLPGRKRKQASECDGNGKTPKKRKTNIQSIVTPSPPKASALCKSGMSLPLNDKPEKKKKISMRCRKCNNNNRDSPNLKFHCVPKYPEEIKSKNPSKARVLKREGQILLRKEIMDRIGESRACDKKLYVCNEHQFETVVKYRMVNYNEKQFAQRYMLTVPRGEGAASSLHNSKHVSKGVGHDRALRVILDDATKHKVDNSIHAEGENLDSLLQQLQSEYDRLSNPSDRIANLEEQNLVREAKLEIERSNTTQALKAMQQISEQTCHDQHIPLNPSLEHAVGMHSIGGNAEEIAVPNKNFFHSQPVKKSIDRTKAVLSDPVVNLGMSDKEVKRRTGFPSEKALLLYMFVVCNGDIETIIRRSSPISWYEEWFMYFEYIWGKSLTRLIDVEKEYKISKRDAEAILSAKVNIAYTALSSWPTYASYKEDVSLRERKAKWKTKWVNHRPVCWDMTDIVAYEFTDANMQRITYSQYYGHNCFKGGILTQFCGWHGNSELWTGAVSDTDYNRRSGYLKTQEQFQNEDLVEYETDDGRIDLRVLPFLNIYDKGYRAKMAALKNGKQQVLQPDWAESDRTFNRYQTIGSASIASDRGGNERSVNVMKRAGYLRRGFQPNMCPVRFNKVWRTWGFQSNFMFVPIL